jgi:hypothetical protein
VVLVTQRVSNDALYHQLDGDLPRVFRVGDCVAPRLLAEAIFDGHRLAREIDGPDPEVALPFLRERPMSDARSDGALPEPIVPSRPPPPARREVELLGVARRGGEADRACDRRS